MYPWAPVFRFLNTPLDNDSAQAYVSLDRSRFMGRQTGIIIAAFELQSTLASSITNTLLLYVAAARGAKSTPPNGLLSAFRA